MYHKWYNTLRSHIAKTLFIVQYKRTGKIIIQLILQCENYSTIKEAVLYRGEHGYKVHYQVQCSE